MKKFNSIGFAKKSAIRIGSYLITGGALTVLAGMHILTRGAEWYRGVDGETVDMINELQGELSKNRKGGNKE
ncbi:MAG: hypothetical protein LBT06_10760 [Hungatella sp.]|jgi:hypothetical protein|nr:hypothetical protein [Hungatella sp.]